MEARKKEIADLISIGDTAAALQLARDQFPKLTNKLVVLQGKFSKVENRFHAGALSLEKYNEGVAAISFDLINMMSGSEKNIKTGGANLPIMRLITFQSDFLKSVISEFSRSKIILFASLVFILIVGLTTIFLISELMPTEWGQIILSATLFAFFSLVVSSLGFINVQIKQFKGSESFLKFQELKDHDS